ncbi:MAG: cyclophilin-like family protein [Candidatus Bathyarchaeia archaeon]
MSISKIPVRVIVEGLGEAQGTLVRILSPRTVDAIVRLLPLEGRAAIWQSKVYFGIPLRMGVEKPRNFMRRGDIAYWPLGRAFCIFFGDMRPHGPVNLIGQITDGIDIISKVRSGTRIRVEKI